MINILDIVSKSKISNIIDKFNLYNNYPSDISNRLTLFCKKILFGPKLSSKLFSNVEKDIYVTKNFETINLDRYLTDKLIYQLYKDTNPDLISELKNKNLLNNKSTNSDNSNSLIIIKNDFPYVIPKSNYELYVIWNLNKDRKLSSQNILEIFNLSMCDYIIWKNPQIYKSIPNIDHYHLLIRPLGYKYKLKRLFIVARHGPREPIFMTKKFISKYWDIKSDSTENDRVYSANLTNEGRLNCKFIGNVIKLNYLDEFDFNLDQNECLVTSTNFERTIESAVLTMEGLGLTNNYSDIKITDFISSDSIFTPEQKKSYDDKMSNPKIVWNENLESLNNELEELTGVKIINFRSYFDLACTLRCYEFHNYKVLEDDESNKRLIELRPIIYNLSTFYYNKVHDPENKYFGESKILGRTVYKKIFELLKSTKYKFGYFSTHDNIIMPLVKNLIYDILKNKIKLNNMNYDLDYLKKNIISKMDFMDFPDFNSQVRFEIWDCIEQTDIKMIRIYYNSLMLFEFNTE